MASLMLHVQFGFVRPGITLPLYIDRAALLLWAPAREDDLRRIPVLCIVSSGNTSSGQMELELQTKGTDPKRHCLSWSVSMSRRDSSVACQQALFVASDDWLMPRPRDHRFVLDIVGIPPLTSPGLSSG